MREDWDRRAREDAQYYVAFGRRKQSREEFFASATEVLRILKHEFRRFPPGADFSKLSALEIGCGPGRLMLPLSEAFGQIAGVDVSGEMIELARENLAGRKNAKVVQNSGADLSGFASESVDFCYSYAVFQHIPVKEVVWNYLREACRVLRKGGLLKFQLSGLPAAEVGGHPPRNGWSLRSAVPQAPPVAGKGGPADTWQGVNFRPEEVAHFLAEQNLQLLALNGFDTQYLWIAARKPGAMSTGDSGERKVPPRIVQVTNTLTDDVVVPRSGCHACGSLWVTGLDGQADLNSLAVDVDGELTAPCFIGKHAWNGPTQVNFYLPPGVRSGIVPVSLRIEGEAASNKAPMRVIGPGPWVPKFLGVSDGVDLLSQRTIASRSIKVNIAELGVSSPEELLRIVAADLDGVPIEKISALLVEPLTRRYVLNLAVPETLESGLRHLNVRVGNRGFPPVLIEISAN